MEDFSMDVNLKELINQGEIKEGGHRVKVPIKKPNGENYDGQTYMIPLEYLYYNDENGRVIISMQEERNKNESTIKPGHLEEYNTMMQEMLSKDHNGNTTREIMKLKNDILVKGQQEPGYVLLDGRVIDGNRRLTAVRMLEQDASVVEKQYYEAVLLDDLSIDNFNDKENIKALELQIQHGRLDKVDYHPVDKALDAYRTIVLEQVLSIEKYANHAGLTSKNVNDMILEAELIIKFLEFVNAKKTNYSLARELDLDGPLQEIRTKYKGFKNQENATELLNSLFAKIIQMRLTKEDFKADYRSIKKGVLGTEKEKEFIEHMEDATDTLIDAFESEDEISSFNDIRKTLNEDKNYKSALEEVEEVSNIFALEVSNKEMLEEPAKLMKRALKNVQSVDIGIIEKLNSEDKKEFLDVVNDIKLKLDELI